MKNVFSISSSLPFLKTLAEFIVTTSGGQDDIQNTLLLLPTRRAVRDFMSAFAEINKQDAAFIPRAISLSDADETEIFFEDDLNLEPLPPAVSELELRFILAKLIMAKDSESSLSEAFFLAGELAELMSQTQTELLSFEALDSLVPENYAEHWQQSLSFLKIISEAVPQILKENGKLAPAFRRAELIKRSSQLYLHQLQTFKLSRIIIAGTTASLPPTRQMVKELMENEKVSLILPGLDFLLDEKSFEVLNESSPQYGMKDLLADLKVARHEVHQIGESTSLTAGRERLISEVMRPAETLHFWDNLKLSEQATSGINSLNFSNNEDEALGISLIIKKAVLDKKKVALVTPNRSLAKRVATKLSDVGVAADDSSGTPFDKTLIGRMISAIALSYAKNFTPVSVLNLLYLPQIKMGFTAEEFDVLRRDFEKHILRGLPPPPGIAGLYKQVEARCSKLKNGLYEKILSFIKAFEKSFMPLLDVPEKAPFATFFSASLKVSENLMKDADGKHILWNEEWGETLSEMTVEITTHSEVLAEVSRTEFSESLPYIMNLFSVRPPLFKNHEVIILGQIEARLLDAQVVVLGSLNDGTFPKEAEVSPWMSEDMKKRFGLPSSSRKVGLAAHDFTMALGKKEVYLTRALKEGGVPTTASRFLLRLDAALAAAEQKLPDGSSWLEIVNAINHKQKSTTPPRASANPPMSARNIKEFYATKIRTLMRSPYDFYAEQILKLRKLDGLEAEPELSDFGNIIHNALKEYMTSNDDSAQNLIAIIERDFAQNNLPLNVLHFWLAKIKKIAEFIADDFKKNKSSILQSLHEQKGSCELSGFTLSAKADRIDARDDGLDIIDYKTGSVPKKEEVKSAWDPQLALEALIAEAGGFNNLKKRNVNRLLYYKLGGKKGGEISAIEINDKDENIIEKTALRTAELLDTFFKKQTPFIARPISEYAPKYSDYEHLERIDGWEEG